MLSPPRLPALWVGFNAVATGHRILARTGLDPHSTKDKTNAK